MTILDTHTCLDLLRTGEVGRLAVSITNHPDIFPINYVVDRGTVVFRTAEGTKLAGALLGRGVAFEVDGYDAEAGEAWSVVIKGYAVEIEQMHEFFDALDLPLFPWHAAPEAPVRADRTGRDHRPPIPRRRPRGVGRRPLKRPRAAG